MPHGFVYLFLGRRPHRVGSEVDPTRSGRLTAGLLLALLSALLLAPASHVATAAPSGDLRLVDGRPPAGMLNDPRGVAVARADGTIYAVDAAHARIQVFTAAGVPLGHWGVRGSGEGDFWRPSDVAVSPDGRSVYVVDSGHRRVLRFRPTPACYAPPFASSCFAEAWGGRGNGDGLFETPVAVAVDGSGRVFVADQDRNVVQVFDATGTWLRTFGGAGSELGQLLRPTDLATTPGGEVWVADHDNHRIQRFTADGVVRGFFEGGPDRRLYRPAGVAVGPDGSFVVADYRPEGLLPRVTRYGPDKREAWRRDMVGPGVRRGGAYPQLGVAITDAETAVVADPREPQFALWLINPLGKPRPFGLRGRGDDHFDQPVDVAVDPHFWAVSDAALSRVLLLDPATGAARVRIGGLYQSGASLEHPAGVAVHRTGTGPQDARVYIADPVQHAIFVVGGDGGAIDRWGEDEAVKHPGGFDSPHDVAVSSSGEVYVADTLNSRVVRRAPDGGVLNLVSEAGDAPGELRYPMAVAVADVEGEGTRVYTLERNQSRLQAFSPHGTPIGHWTGAAKPDEAERGALWGPIALAADADHVYVLESDEREHVRLAVYEHPKPGSSLSDARVEILSDRVGAVPGRLWLPRGMGVSAEGAVAVADAGNSRVQLFARTGGDRSPSTPPESPTSPPPTSPPPTATVAPGVAPTATLTAEPTVVVTATATATATPSTPDPAPSATPEPASPTAAPTQLPTWTPIAPATATTVAPTEMPQPSETPVPPTVVPDPSPTEPVATEVPPTTSTPMADTQPTPVTRRSVYLPMLLSR